MKKNIWNIIISTGAIIIVAGLGSLFVNLGMDWFNSLEKPTQWIPNIVIPIVWTVVYLAFAIILFLWLKKESLPKSVLIYLIINGILNILWCLVFFTLNQLFIGNIIIIINLILGIKLVLEIAKTQKIYALVVSIYPT